MLSRESVRRSVLDSLRNLHTEYLDLYLVHWPGAGSGKGLGEKNKEYRRLAWDELTQLHKWVEFRVYSVVIACLRVRSSLMSVDIRID